MNPFIIIITDWHTPEIANIIKLMYYLPKGKSPQGRSQAADRKYLMILASKFLVNVDALH